MKSGLLISMLLTVLLSSPASARNATLTLKDGSTLRGQVTSLNNGVYTLTSSSLGTVTVAAANVESISYSDRGAGVSADSTARNTRSSGRSALNSGQNQAQIQQLQRSLAADSTTMTMISRLQDDPQLKAILADPEIMRAVSSGDLSALMANEKFMQLMNNPSIKEITRQVQGDTP